MPPGPITTDYLVVGAGAMGMAFTDALIDHADVHVTLVDRRYAPGGHWQDAYPFVQLHQASLFYGVASTQLGDGSVQQSGPEAGLHERARRAEIQAYYDDVLHRRFVATGRVTFLGGHDHRTHGDDHVVTSLVSGATTTVHVRRRVVDAESLDDLFLRLEAAGVMLRIDRDVTPTMAKTPTLGRWELDLLRTVEHVVRLGHIERITSAEIVLAGGSVPLPPGSLVVHCAASGLRYPPRTPIWAPDAIRIQTSRAGFPCFGAALAGYVEATRDDDRDRNRLCPPNAFSDSLASWAAMQVRGAAATRAFGAEPDIAAWSDSCALNPARVLSEQRDDPAVQAATARLADHAPAGLSRLAELAGV